MSLVNDMLRDLDRRRRLPSDSTPLRYDDDDDMETVVHHWIIIALVVVGLLVGTLAGYFYFRQAGISAPEMAAAPEPQAPPVVETATQPVIATPARSISVAPAVTSPSGFVLKIASATVFVFEIVSRDNFGINILLHEVEQVASNAAGMPGFSLVQSEAGVNAIVELNESADYLVYQERGDVESPGMTLVIEAMLRGTRTEAVTEVAPPAQERTVVEEAPAPIEPVEEPVATPPEPEVVVVPPAPRVATTEPVRTIPTPAPTQASIRTPRELTFEERDLNVSQNAGQLIQRGQLVAAYQALLVFLGENPEAHRSRETLATLLFAQQEYLEAGVVVDQGLVVAPNYAPYKKIKARLYMLSRETAAAIALLRNLPPNLAADPEYFELLASSYQQNGSHQEAIEVYQNLLRNDSQQARWWAGLGISHEALGNVSDAIASYQAALQTENLEPALRQYSQNRIRYLGN